MKFILFVFILHLGSRLTADGVKHVKEEEYLNYLSRNRIPQDANFITQSFPLNLLGPNGVFAPPTSVKSVVKGEKTPGVYVYASNSYPLTINNPLNMYSLPRVFDLYQGLKAPYNLQHPTNYRYGINPFAHPGYGPNIGYGEPFTNGIYQGFTNQNWGFLGNNPLPPAINPFNGGQFPGFGLGMQTFNQGLYNNFGNPGIAQGPQQQLIDQKEIQQAGLAGINTGENLKI